MTPSMLSELTCFGCGWVWLRYSKGTTVVVDDFSYHKLAPEAWGQGSSWVFLNGSATPVLRLDCPPNATTEVVRPVASSLLAAREAGAPCTDKPQPCPSHPGVTFCPSDKAPGQCSKPMPHKPVSSATLCVGHCPCVV